MCSQFHHTLLSLSPGKFLRNWDPKDPKEKKEKKAREDLNAFRYNESSYKSLAIHIFLCPIKSASAAIGILLEKEFQGMDE